MLPLRGGSTRTSNDQAAGGSGYASRAKEGCGEKGTATDVKTIEGRSATRYRTVAFTNSRSTGLRPDINGMSVLLRTLFQGNAELYRAFNIRQLDRRHLELSIAS
uniref:Uncharacterized protein n=1 Tax=Corethron hystrix TaxID=216773 RepID=A0A6U5DU76_9STRA